MSMTNAVPSTPSADQVIGDRVHQLMWRAKITQTALAPELGISQAALSHKLRGRRGWSADDLMTLARYFSVSIDYLFGSTDDMGPGYLNLPPSD